MLQIFFVLFSLFVLEGSFDSVSCYLKLIAYLGMVVLRDCNIMGKPIFISFACNITVHKETK